MANKPLHQVKEEIDIIGQYKWEFLRRNKEYQKDYEQYIQAEEKASYELEEEDIKKWVENQTDELYEKWWIDYLYVISPFWTQFLFTIGGF